MREPRHDRFALYLSPEHPCAYLEGQTARTLFLDPQLSPSIRLYRALAQQGFRRSGDMLYRPQCSHCHACVPIRIPVAEFQPDRSQRRTWNRNRDLDVRMQALNPDAEHYALYRRYQAARHPGGGMDQHSEAEYRAFLASRWCQSQAVEMRLDGRLVAVAITDAFEDSLSAVYTFYEPDLPRRSLGSHAILWQIEAARQRGLRWLYLGYWIASSRKMAYKNRFRPHECLGPEGWQRIS